MTKREMLIEEINHTPDQMVEEFYQLYLLFKEKNIRFESLENSVASQHVLMKKWETPDEDKAWADL